MTYCIAWKKNKKVYMIGDSATSAIKDDIQSPLNTFGETQGLYGKYMVQEGTLKLYKITDNVAVCFSGDKKTALEAIESIYNQIEFNSIENILKNIKNTYSGNDTVELELLIAVSYSQDDNHIYYFDGNVITEIHDFVCIGSGKECDKLTEDVKWHIDNLYKQCSEKFDYLANIISYLQCFSIKNKLYKYGVGGVFFGVVIDSKVRWCKDILYYLYDEKVLNGKSVSVLARNNSVFSSTDIDGGVRFILNEFKDIVYWEDPYYKESVVKILNTGMPMYTIFYSQVYNHMSFTKVNGWMQNSLFKRWIRRGDKKVDFAYVFGHSFSKFLEKTQQFNDESPTFSYLGSVESEYITHQEIVKRLGIEEEKVFDYELKMFDHRGFDKKIYKAIRQSIPNYKNIVIIDFGFLCDIIEEKIQLYGNDNVTIKNLDLEQLVYKFMIQIASREYLEYGIIVIKRKTDDRVIDGLVMTEFFDKYENSCILELDDEKYIDDFCGIALEIIKDYYINEKFFKIDKLIFIEDNSKFNNVLQVVPQFNFEAENPNIILVRNFNGLTNMDGRFRYVVVDYLVGFMLGLTMEEIAELEYKVIEIN